LAALAAPASGSELDSYVVWATNLHLNVVARGRAPEIDHKPFFFSEEWRLSSEI